MIYHGDRLPDADLSDQHVAELVESLPLRVRAKSDDLGCRAIALAREGLDLVEDCEELTAVIGFFLDDETDRVDNGGDLVVAVLQRLGVEITADVIGGLFELMFRDRGRLTEQGSVRVVEALRRYARS